MSAADIVVVGAGIVGAACAHELANAGLTVRVLDARLGGATNAGMGHLVVMDDNPAELALSALSLEIWRAWGPTLSAQDARCAYAVPGTLWIAADDEEMDEAARKRERLLAAGVDCELWDAKRVAAAEPALRRGLSGGLRVSGDALVYAPNAAAGLLEQSGARVVLEKACVAAIDEAGVVLADGRRIDCGAVVLAAGIDAARLSPDLPLRPKKGHLVITDRYPGLVRHQLVELGYVKSAHHATGTSVAFNAQPRPTGQLLLGSSRQFDSTDPVVENAIVARMLRRALDYLPCIDGVNAIRTWTGFRCATPDGLPIVGAHPQRAKLWLAVGHEGLGVTSAPATARLLAAQIVGATPPLDVTPYAASRFVPREER